MLATVFSVQATFLLGAWSYCFWKGHEACPEIGNRTEQMFNVAIATTLSLLAASKPNNK